MGDVVLPESVRRAIEARPSHGPSADGDGDALAEKIRRLNSRKRRRFEPPWPVNIPNGNWYEAYPRCLRPSQNGQFNCEIRPMTRGNFYCKMHGGDNPHTLRKSKERYIYWCMAGEPFLNPDIFDQFMVIWLKRLGDRLMEMPVSKQLKFLEIAAELLKERDAETSEDS